MNRAWRDDLWKEVTESGMDLWAQNRISMLLEIAEQAEEALDEIAKTPQVMSLDMTQCAANATKCIQSMQTRAKRAYELFPQDDGRAVPQ